MLWIQEVGYQDRHTADGVLTPSRLPRWINLWGRRKRGNTEYRVIQKVLDDCIKSDDGTSCLKSKVFLFLGRAARGWTRCRCSQECRCLSRGHRCLQRASRYLRQVSLGTGATRTRRNLIKWSTTVWLASWPTAHLSWTSPGRPSKKVRQALCGIKFVLSVLITRVDTPRAINGANYG